MTIQLLKRYSMAVALVFCTTGTVLAHHSYAQFDMGNTVSVQGTVKQWDWTNPHSWLTLYVEPGNGVQPEVWEIESGSPSMLLRTGFTRTSLTVGEKVTVKFHPHRDDPHKGSLVAVDFPGGKSLTVDGSKIRDTQQ